MHYWAIISRLCQADGMNQDHIYGRKNYKKNYTL